MSRCDHTDHLLRVLRAPRRNNYFYGKRLDVQHFRMEQDYGKEKQWLLNRLTLGKGVLCGLRVTLEDGRLCVSPGVAIDGLGREIIVPVASCINPLPLPDPCRPPAATRAPDPGDAFDPNDDLGGMDPQTPFDPDDPTQPAGPDDAADDGERIVTLWLCYRECTTDPMPVLVADCDVREQCAPGTIVESFCLKVTDGAPPILGDPEWCADLCPCEDSDTTPTPTPSPAPTATPSTPPFDAAGNLTGNVSTTRPPFSVNNTLSTNSDDNANADNSASENLVANPQPGDPPPPDPIPDWLTAGDDDAEDDSCRRQLCQSLDDDCDPDPSDPCVPLAAVLLRDGTVAGLEICAVRPRIYSNAVLLDMILCLAARCDGQVGPTPSPTPTPSPAPTPTPTATPTPEPRPLLQVAEVRFRGLNNPDLAVTFNLGQNPMAVDFPVAEIDVLFTKDVRPDTLTAAAQPGLNPAPFSVLLEGPSDRFPNSVVPVLLSLPATNLAQLRVQPEFVALRGGSYRLRLFGDADLAAGRPAIADTDNMRLDGEPLSLPSGDGAQGGTFDIAFIIG